MVVIQLISRTLSFYRDDRPRRHFCKVRTHVGGDALQLRPAHWFFSLSFLQNYIAAVTGGRPVQGRFMELETFIVKNVLVNGLLFHETFLFSFLIMVFQCFGFQVGLIKFDCFVFHHCILQFPSSLVVK